MVGTLTTADGVIDLETVRAVYYRRPTTYRFPDELSEEDRVFAAAQARNGFGGVLASLDCRWVNHPAAMCDAGFKPAQLTAAVRAGLSIPSTLITNSSMAAREFAASLNGPMVYKTFTPSPLLVNGESAGVYTSVVELGDLGDDTGIGLTACLFQAFVPKAFDARITVIGDKCFGAAIRANSEASRIDFRADYGNLTYQPVDVPDHVRGGLCRYLRGFGLSFAAVDMAVTENDEWLFLEANPNGQWSWIEQETGLPIADAFARFLVEGV